MKIHTATLGVVEAAPDSFLTLPDGLIGFEEHKEFALLELSDYRPFRWLQSFSDPGLSFPVLDPHAFVSGYEPSLSDADKAGLGFEAGETPIFYAIATVEDSGKNVTINLRAPLVVHPKRRIARQVVLADSRWEIQHTILEPARRTNASRAKAAH